MRFTFHLNGLGNMECLTMRHLTKLRLARKSFPAQIWMRTWSSEVIRTSFIDFFKSYEHGHIPSSSVIPPKGEGTYFTNAGMNQFKPIFLGTCDSSSKLWGIRRAVNSQKCIRVGGKHNDLEDVGHDLTHHTFFEMLGNWSFGDYFKREACAMAYQLLTEHYRLPLNRLYFTYFAGDEELGLPADEECHDIWASLGIPLERILPFGPKDNFWDMGVTGPCGPCTEIHFDHIGNRLAPSEVNSCSPSLVEIWNLVFMQYNRQADGSLEHLPARHVDTGMGLERITAVLNGTQDNYGTDLFKPIFSVIQQMSKCPPYSSQLNRLDTSYRQLADHARMFTVSISDGLLPRNDNLGHKLRGILNKCIQLSRSEFKVDPNVLLPALVQPVVSSLGDAHPELISKESLVKDVVGSAVDHHDKMVEQASRSFNKMMSRQQPSTFLSGETVLALEKGHYGSTMSLDFIEVLAAERNMHIDKLGYEKCLQQHQTGKPSTSTPVTVSDKTIVSDLISHLLSDNTPGTDDSFKYSLSPYLDLNESTASIASFECQVEGLSRNGQVTQALEEGWDGEVVLDKTTFYAESGGQEADTGSLVSEDGVFTVTDVQKQAGYVIHSGQVTKGCLRNGQIVQPYVSMHQRQGNMRNHTATHLLHAALQEVLPNTQQQGSNVSWSKMTFDFLTLSKFDGSDLQFVDNKVRECIQRHCAVQTELVPFSSIYSIPDVRFSANEDYPEEVRLVSIVTEDGKSAVSRELCGGTHVPDTSYLEDFCVTHLGSQSQNVKRATCVTGLEAQQAHLNGRLMSDMCHLLAVAIVTSKGKPTEHLPLVQSLKDKAHQTEQFLSQRKHLLVEDFENFEGVGGTKMEELISDTTNALAITKLLQENLTLLTQGENHLVEFLSSLVKIIKKTQQLDLLPKTCRDQANACLLAHEHKVTERVNARNTQLLLQQIDTAIESQGGDMDDPCIIDVSPHMDSRKLVKTLSKKSFQCPLVLIQQTQNSYHVFVSLASEETKLETSPSDFLAKLLMELKDVGKLKGKVVTRLDSGAVYSLSGKGVLPRHKVVSVLEKLVKGR